MIDNLAKCSMEVWCSTVRSAQGNLRLCRNLCYGSLIEACRETKKIVTISHVNNVLVQPHWRSHEELIKQQVSP